MGIIHFELSKINIKGIIKSHVNTSIFKETQFKSISLKMYIFVFLICNL